MFPSKAIIKCHTESITSLFLLSVYDMAGGIIFLGCPPVYSCEPFVGQYSRIHMQRTAVIIDISKSQ